MAINGNDYESLKQRIERLAMPAESFARGASALTVIAAILLSGAALATSMVGVRPDGWTTIAAPNQTLTVARPATSLTVQDNAEGSVRQDAVRIGDRGLRNIGERINARSNSARRRRADWPPPPPPPPPKAVKATLIF